MTDAAPHLLRLATRRSDLAMAQTRMVAERLAAAQPGLEVEIVPIESSGDRDRTSPVAALTEVGAFVRALQEAVLDGRADAAVHSCKDLPVSGPPGLFIAAYPDRDDPRDAMVGAAVAELEPGAVVGTGSPRRVAQLMVMRPDLETTELRGNVDTRLAKVAAGDVDAAVLAMAGLRRLGRADAVAEALPVDVMVPAPAQGAIAVEAMRGSAAAELLAAIDDRAVRAAVTVERNLLAHTGAGCRSALGAYATVTDDQIELRVFVDDEAGSRHGVVQADEPYVAVIAAARELGLERSVT